MKGAGAAIVVGSCLGLIAALLLEALLVMLLLSGLHEYVSESIPALGYGPSILVAVALNFVGGFFRR